MATQSFTDMTSATVAEVTPFPDSGIVISDQDLPENPQQVQNALPNSLIIRPQVMDDRAQALVDNWNAACGKLVDLYHEVVSIQHAFDDLKDGETILGCRSFKIFCIRHLHRDPSTVYRMMAKARLAEDVPPEDTSFEGDENTDEEEEGEEDEGEDGENEENEEKEEEKGKTKSKRTRLNKKAAQNAYLADLALRMIGLWNDAPKDASLQAIGATMRAEAQSAHEDLDAETAANIKIPKLVELPGQDYANLKAGIMALKAEKDNLMQRLEALSSVPDYLRDETITATLAAEPDRDKASDMLKQYFVTIAQRILPPHMALNTADALLRIHVLFAGRDHRIVIGDWLEKKGVEDHSPTLCKCVGIAEFMQRRRVQEWSVNKWEKERVVYSGDESSYQVITEARARELAPEIFEPPPDPPSTSKVGQDLPETEAEETAAVTVTGDNEPKIGDKGGRTDHYYWEVVKSETLPYVIRYVSDDQVVKQCKSKEKAEAAISLYEKNLASTGSVGSETTQQPQDTGKDETYEDRGGDGADRRPVVS
jgi:hypothetical protein